MRGVEFLAGDTEGSIQSGAFGCSKYVDANVSVINIEGAGGTPWWIL